MEIVFNKTVKAHLIKANLEVKSELYQLAIFSIGKAYYELEKSETVVKGKRGENVLAKPNIVNYLIKYKTGFGGRSPSVELKDNLKEI